MPKIPIALRLSDEAIRLLDALSDTLGLTKTAVVELAIRMLAKAHKIVLPSSKKR